MKTNPGGRQNEKDLACWRRFYPAGKLVFSVF